MINDQKPPPCPKYASMTGWSTNSEIAPVYRNFAVAPAPSSKSSLTDSNTVSTSSDLNVKKRPRREAHNVDHREVCSRKQIAYIWSKDSSGSPIADAV